MSIIEQMAQRQLQLQYFDEVQEINARIRKLPRAAFIFTIDADGFPIAKFRQRPIMSGLHRAKISYGHAKRSEKRMKQAFHAAIEAVEGFIRP